MTGAAWPEGTPSRPLLPNPQRAGTGGPSLRLGSALDPGGNAAALLARLAELHGEMADIYRQLGEIQLDGSPHPPLMDGVDGRHDTGGTASVSERLLTVRDIADRLQVDEKTIRRWREEGTLPAAVQVGGIIRWRAQDIDAWIEEQLR